MGVGASVAGNPFAYASFLAAIDHHLEPLQAVLIGDPASTGIHALRRSVLDLPAAQPVIQYVSPGESLPPRHPAHGKEQKEGRPTLYLCRGTRCAAPVTEPADAASVFAGLG